MMTLVLIGALSLPPVLGQSALVRCVTAGAKARPAAELITGLKGARAYVALRPVLTASETVVVPSLGVTTGQIEGAAVVATIGLTPAQEQTVLRVLADVMTYSRVNADKLTVGALINAGRLAEMPVHSLLAPVADTDLMIRYRLAEIVLGTELSAEQLDALALAHQTRPIPEKARILYEAGYTTDQASDLMRLGIAGKSTRSFDVSEAPEEAQRIVDSIKTADAFGGGAPPGVFAGKDGPGEFSAIAPVGTAKAKLTVESNGRGGSTVTETFKSRSLIPFGSSVIDAVHGVFTDPQKAYNAARRRRR